MSPDFKIIVCAAKGVTKSTTLLGPIPLIELAKRDAVVSVDGSRFKRLPFHIKFSLASAYSNPTAEDETPAVEMTDNNFS